MFGKLFAFLTVFTLLATKALSGIDMPAVETRFGTFAKQGQAEYRFLGQPMYNAALYTPSGQNQTSEGPAGLALNYQRRFSGSVLVWASMAELRRIEGDQADHTSFETGLRTCFQDVEKGDRYLALAATADEIEFWLNNTKTCSLTGARWAERFLAIWLSDQSRDQRAARLLRGGEG